MAADMTPLCQSIIDERTRIQEEIERHEGEIEVLRAQWRVLQRRCKHPAKFKTSTMGELGEHCSDCGWDI